jgi:monoamine oxidase
LGLKLVDFEQRRGKSGPEIALRGAVIPRAQWTGHPLNAAPEAYRADFPGRRVIEKVIDANNPLASAGDWIEPTSAKFDESVYAFLSRLGWSDAAIALNYDTNIGRGTSAHDCSVLTWFFRRAWDNLQTEIENVALKVVGGNQALPEAMAAKLGDAVRVNAAVAGLRSDGDGIEAYCEDGSVHHARFAICATPITPLRWIRFDPLLPPVLAEAIARLPSMRITKVFLNAKRPFWADDGLSPPMWTDTVAGEVAALRQAADSDRITGLIARVRGYSSMYLDTLGERDAGAAVVAAIETLRPAAKGQLEVAGYKSWAVDRFSGGTWAEWEPGQIHRFLPELVKPAGRIHFAGEHASLANRGMEAAMEAGERAALEVMARL